PKRFSMSYHLLALRPGAPRLRLQVWVDDGEPVPSVVEVWPTADWHEREAWDLMGIRAEGHPNLARILMDDDWEGHPLRKDYPIGGEPVRFSGKSDGGRAGAAADLRGLTRSLADPDGAASARGAA